MNLHTHQKTPQIFVIEAIGDEGKLWARAVTAPDKDGRYTFSMTYRNCTGSQMAQHEVLDRDKRPLPRPESHVAQLVKAAEVMVQRKVETLRVPLEQ